MITRRTLLELATLSAVAAAAPAAEPPFELPKLPYAFDALDYRYDEDDCFTWFTGIGLFALPCCSKRS
jgi:hypothetical protein